MTIINKKSSKDEIKKRLNFIIINKVSSKKELAKALDIAPTTVSAWTTGRILPSIPVLIKIAILTHTSLDWLLLGKDSLNSPDHLTLPSTTVFDKVFLYGYEFAANNQIKVSGSFFLGLYYLVAKEIAKSDKTIPEIIEENKKVILHLSNT